jgi:hypothetical protein
MLPLLIGPVDELEEDETEAGEDIPDAEVIEGAPVTGEDTDGARTEAAARP